MMTNLSRTLLLWGVWIGLSTANAQITSPDPEQNRPAQRERMWAFKFAPLSLFDPDNTVQFGIERLLGRRHGIQAEFGYGWQGINLWQNSQSQRYSDREVWRGRAEYRYYLRKRFPLTGQYVAVEGLYKQVNAFESGTVGVGCESGPCQYYRLFRSPVTKSVWAGHVKFGNQFTLSDDARWLMDVYIGIGVRQSSVSRFRPPADSYYYPSAGFSLFDAFSPQPYPITSFAYGLKIGYSL